MNFKNLIDFIFMFADPDDRVDVHVDYGVRSSVHTFNFYDFYSDSVGTTFLKEFSHRIVKSFAYVSMENNRYKIYI